MTWREVTSRLPKVLMLFSLCCVCFSYGLAAGQYKLFPYQLVDEAGTAFSALLAARESAPAKRTLPHAVTGMRSAPLLASRSRALSPSAGDELLLVSGGAGYLSEHGEAGCLAWLMDRQGEIQHVWHYDPDLWRDLKSVSRVPLVSGDIYPVGLHLLDDGGLLATFQGENTYPFAIGIARFDVDSRLLWKREIFAHHWFSVTEDGRVIVPALRVMDSPLPVGRTRAAITSDTGKIYSDTIVVLDKDGQVLDEISMLDALIDSGWGGLLGGAGFPRSAEFAAPDPLHLNDVQRAGTRGAAAQPWLSPDDLLVSFACLNTVGILDPTTRRFKWLSAGATIGQHSPRFHDGGVLVLDNLGGVAELGGTQLVHIDLERGQPTVVFPRAGTPPPGECRTETSGHLDISSDDRRVLLTLANAATVWEIDAASGEVLWEYNYVHADDTLRDAKIHTAKYVVNPTFLHARDDS